MKAALSARQDKSLLIVARTASLRIEPIDRVVERVRAYAATGVDANRNLVIGHEQVSLAPGTPETDVELGYVTTFLDGALALQANAGYQMNLAGQKGQNSVTVLSRAKINF